MVYTLLAMKNTFVTTQHKAIEAYPAIAAAPVKTSNEFKVTPIHNLKLALIPKQNIGVDPTYQRQLNIRQIANIHKNWDYDLYEPVCVYMHRDTKTGLTYYQATDGQHRLCAHPDADVLCRIVNTKAAVTRCIQANDVNTKKGWSTDDRFWAKKVEIDRVGVEDDTLINFTIAAFESKGWNPLHPKKQTPTDIGGKIATIHKYFAKYINRNIRSRGSLVDGKFVSLNRDEQDHLAEQAILDTVNLMEGLYGPTYVAYAGRIWCALFDWLTHKKGLNNSYDYNTVFRSLHKGELKLARDRQFREVKTTTSLYAAANLAIAKGLVTDRQHEALFHVLNKIYEGTLKTSVC